VGALSDRLWARKAELNLSIKTLAKQSRVPIHRATIYKYLNDEGAKEPPEHTVRGLAAAFELSEKEIRDLLGMPSGDGGPWQPPEESARLSRDQREALDRLIKTIVGSLRPVTPPLSETIIDESHYKSSDQVASTPKVGEDRRHSRRGRGPKTTKGVQQSASPPVPPQPEDETV